VEKARSLFASNNYAEARFLLCVKNYWCRGLVDEDSRKSWNSLYEFKSDLRWSSPLDTVWIDRAECPLIVFAAWSDCLLVVQQALAEIEKISDIEKRTTLISQDWVYRENVLH